MKALLDRSKPAERIAPRPGPVARFLSTDPDWGAAVARVVLAVVVAAHGAQKLFGWWGGYGFKATVAWFREAVGVPAPLAALLILAETLGMVALAAGLAGRLMAGAVAVIMVGAIATQHLPNGFFMNWSGSLPGEGYEFHLLALGLALVVLIRGSGALSVDRWLARKAS